MSAGERSVLLMLFWGSLIATVYTYFLYPLLLWLAGKLIRRQRRRSPMEEGSAAVPATALPTVTMVISAYNEAAILPDKIANCQALDYPAQKLSFLIGSDGCDDGSWRILGGIKDKRFRSLHIPQRQGKVQMLNRLMKQASCDIVVFSDANTMYQPNAIRELVRCFAADKVGIVIGKLELTAAANPRLCQPEGWYWRYENRIKQMESLLAAVPTVNGGIFAIRRELYEELPAQAVTEDQVLGMKIMVRGRRCLFAPQAIARESISNWRDELRRRIRISAGNFQSLFLVPRILNPRCGRVWLTFVSHKLLRWLVPFFMAIMLAANLLLVGEPFYGSILLAQGIFYLCGMLGAVLPNLGGVLKVLAVPKYILAMNLAILLGLGRFLSGRQRVTWAKAARR